MALKDILSNLAGNVFTPGVEELISAVPALVGSYEQGRGKPIGNVLSTLGQFGLTNAANRQVEHQKEADVAGRLESLSAQGLLPKDFYTSGTAGAIMGTGPGLGGMTPEAADKELTDIEGRQVAEQQRQQAETTKMQDWQREHMKPFYLSPTGKEAYLPDPSGKTFGTRAPQYDKDPGAEAKTEMQLFLTDRPKWNEMMAAKAQYSIGSANSKVAGRFDTLLNKKLDSTPIQMVPELKNDVLLDRDTLRPVSLTGPGAPTLRDALTNPKYAFVDKKTGTETLPNMAAARRQVVELASYAAKVLPGGKGEDASFNNFMRTLGNRWGLPFKALSGGVNEAMFGAKRTALALQLQKAFTGSTRPVNLVEFTRITGDDNPGTISTKDIDAVIPTSRDTKEVARAKLNVLQEMFDDKMSQLNANTGAPGVYFKSVNDAMKAAGEMPDAPETPEAPTVITTPTPGSGEDL